MKRFFRFALLLPVVASAQIPLGEFKRGETVPLVFNTYASGASVTITGLAVTDIEIYKGGNIGAGTERSSDAGYTLIDTDGIDIDGMTGAHGVTIDTSNDTVAGFWQPGANYQAYINSITVDSQTVIGLWTFSLAENVFVYGSSQASDSDLTTCDLPASYEGDFADGQVTGSFLHLVEGSGSPATRLIVDYVDASAKASLESPLGTDCDATTVLYVEDGRAGVIAVDGNGRVEANVKAVDDDLSAAQNMEAHFDLSGVALENSSIGWNDNWDAEIAAAVASGGLTLFATTVQTVTNQTNLILADDPGADDYTVPWLVCFGDVSAVPILYDCTYTNDYVSSTKAIQLFRPLTFTIAVGDLVEVTPQPRR